MTPFADWLHALGLTSLDVLWRPLLAWTLVCLPLYAGLRLWRSAPAYLQYHAHLALLLALPLSLVLAPLIPWPAPEAAGFVGDVFALPLPEVGGTGGAVASQAEPQGATWEATHWLGTLTLLAVGWAAFLLIRIG